MKKVRREEFFLLYMELLPIALISWSDQLTAKEKPVAAWFVPTVSKQGRTERLQEIENTSHCLCPSFTAIELHDYLYKKKRWHSP